MRFSKILITILLTITLIFAADVSNVFASTADTLVIHYHRYDDDYSDWSLWLWPKDSEGTDYNFSGSDSFGDLATITLSVTTLDAVDSIGILIKDTNWAKDFGDDRFISMSNPNSSGEVHVYFLQGEEYFSYVSTNQVGCDITRPNSSLCAVSIMSGLIDVYFNDDLELKFIATDSITNNDITIYKDGVEQFFSGFTNGKTGTLLLNNSVIFTDNYTIKLDFDGTLVESIIRYNLDYDSVIFNQVYNYDGILGVSFTETQTTFKLWAPVSSEVEVNLYRAGHTVAIRADGVNEPYDTINMEYVEKGVWEVSVLGNLDGTYYTFNVKNSGTITSDIQDPYGISFGLNGARSMVLDLDTTDPDGWETDAGIDGFTRSTDAIIYELHVRDLTSASSWGGPSNYAGKYLGLTVEDTSYTHPTTGVTVSTGLDHLVELGITHLHLLPTYDQNWNDEVNPDFNWGYNPENFNAPDGGFATDPYDGAVRVNEYKQMVLALHDNGINIINDVVYNHTGNGGDYSFNQIVPGYFFRITNGVWSNGTGVGNETASERYMVNKYIVDSVEYWAKEYHIDGFRFDLMAVHDYKTMNDVANAIEAIDPDNFVYGEPWGGGIIDLPYSEQAGKQNLDKMPLISAFNDDFRNTIKGSPDGTDSGYISTGLGIYDVMKGIEGSMDWSYGNSAAQTVNYVSAHDNLTLYDKLVSASGRTTYGYVSELDYESRLANSIVMFSQGIPFLHAGVDFLRTKGGEHNSYQSSDLTNQLSYVRKAANIETFEYYKGIIEIRKEYESFRMSDYSDINNNLTFLYPDGYGLIGYHLTKNDENILVYHNALAYANEVILPSGAWKLIADRDESGLIDLGTFSGSYPVAKAETLVFIKGTTADVIPSPTLKPEITNSFHTIYEGGDITINSTSIISSYSIDGGITYTSISNPSYKSVTLTDLDKGTYEIIVKNESLTASEIFSLTVISLTCVQNPNQDKCVPEPLVCETGFHSEENECVANPEPLVCDIGYTVLNGDCVKLPEALTCNSNEEVVNGECVLVNGENTGCGGRITPRLSNIALVFGLSSLFLFLRKRK